MRKSKLFTAILVIFMSIVLVFSAVAEDGSVITFQLRVDRNTLLARYGVTFMLDDTVLAHLGQGDRATIITLVKGYEHTLTMVPDKKNAETKTWQLSGIADGTMVLCRIKTHIRYLELKEEGISGGGIEYRRLDENLKVTLETNGVSVTFDQPSN